MRITVLGSASGMAVPNRNSSAYVVESRNRYHLVDAGEGVTRQLAAVLNDHDTIVSVIISHTHPDHASGLFMLLQWMYLRGRTTPLPIYLPEGVLPGFQTVMPYFHIYREKWPFPFELLPIRAGIVFEDGDFRMTAVPNDHLAGNRKHGEKHGIGCDSYSFVWSDSTGKMLYTSDVTALSHLVPHAEGTDILISECTHLTIDEIHSFAAAAKIPRVVLSHIPPELEDAKPVTGVSGAVEFTEDGATIEV